MKPKQKETRPKKSEKEKEKVFILKKQELKQKELLLHSRGDKLATTKNNVPVGIGGGVSALKDAKGINELLKRSQKSTGSMGKCEKKVESETEVKLIKKKRPILLRDGNDEKQFMLKFANRVWTKTQRKQK